MLELVLIEITAVPAERSRGRHHPRVVKRKMSGFPTKARASPPPRQVFRYAEHVRIVAPAAGLERRGADPHLCRAAAEARSKDTDPGPPPKPPSPHLIQQYWT
jgi:hypothetical protein